MQIDKHSNYDKRTKKCIYEKKTHIVREKNEKKPF